MRKGLVAIVGIAILLSSYSMCAADVVTDGLWAWYKLDETSGTNVADWTGVNDATLTGGTWTTDTPGAASSGALYLSGSSEWFQTSYGAGPVISDQFTIEAWIKRDETDVGEDYIAAKNGYYRFMATTAGSLALDFNRASDGASSWHSVSSVITPGIWQHVAATFDGTDVKLYLNGACLYTNDRDAGETFRAGSGTPNFGRYAVGGYVHGALDDVRLYNNNALTEAEILSNYQAIVPEPSSLLLMGMGLLSLLTFVTFRRTRRS